MWIWLVAIIIVVGAWVGGHYLGWSLLLRILLTLVAVLLVVAYYVIRKLRAVAKARAIERELMKQAEQQALNARPDRRAEIIELKVQIERGMRSLRESSLGPDALYTMPWYVIIGPPGAGKTTALKHSGLVFPAMGPTGGAVKGVGGTRNCDWWFTNEAILLDTAGRYMTEGDDHEEWLSFLGLLQKNRPKKPVNGVLVAISVTDLMESNDEKLDAYAKNLRERIDEVMTRLKMIVPVYVVFTKVDLIAGFVEFFGDLKKSDRGQIWGATLPLEGAELRDARTAFETEFDGLVDAAHARALGRMNTERLPEARQRIFQFPLEFSALKTNIGEFLYALFQRNSFQEAPFLRGVYFTSGTQEGRPVDRVVGEMMKAFNIARGPETPAPVAESKSYFVTDMFRKVIFPDQNVAGRTKAERRRVLLNRVAFAGGATALAAIVVAPAGCTFWNNVGLVGDAKRVSTEARQVEWNDKRLSVQDKAKKLDDLRGAVIEYAKWNKDGAPIKYRWGMYTGEDLYKPLREVYVGNLQKGFAQPTKARIEEDLRGITLRGGRLSLDEYNFYFQRLKSYLMASQRDRLDEEWETEAMSLSWSRALDATNKQDKDALGRHVREYFRLMKNSEIDTWNADADLVKRVQATLKQVSEADRNYSTVVRDANEALPPIKRENIFLNTGFSAYVTSREEKVVRGAFTKDGWNEYIRHRFDKDRVKQLAAERWVLGETGEAATVNVEKQLKELQERYFTDYRNEWRDFLMDLVVRQPQTNTEALDELQSLSETPLPYGKLLKVLAENTRLELPPASMADKAGKGLMERLENEVRVNPNVQKALGDGGVPTTEKPEKWVSPVEESFEPLASFGVAPESKPGEKAPPTKLTVYQDQIVAKVVGALNELKDSKVPPKPEKVREIFENAVRTTSELLATTQSGFTRPILSPLLMHPLQASYAGVLRDAVGAAGGKWELDVYKKWKKTLDNRYPFVDSPRDASLEDYTEFFKPETGTLWTFINTNLKGAIEKDGDAFVPTVNFKHSVKFTPEFMKALKRGADISMATFPPKSEKPVVEFELNLHSVSHNVSEVLFEIDGTQRVYRNGPEEWLKIQWPAKEPKERGAKIRIRGLDALNEQINRPGDFGIFRLMDAATGIERGTEGGKPGARPTLVVTWTARTENATVKMDIRPPRNDSAFSSYVTLRQRLFRGYRIPRNLANGVTGSN
jgi:type VI secretion system protein ImpL